MSKQNTKRIGIRTFAPQSHVRMPRTSSPVAASRIRTTNALRPYSASRMCIFANTTAIVAYVAAEPIQILSADARGVVMTHSSVSRSSVAVVSSARRFEPWPISVMQKQPSTRPVSMSSSSAVRWRSFPSERIVPPKSSKWTAIFTTKDMSKCMQPSIAARKRIGLACWSRTPISGAPSSAIALAFKAKKRSRAEWTPARYSERVSHAFSSSE